MLEKTDKDAFLLLLKYLGLADLMNLSEASKTMRDKIRKSTIWREQLKNYHFYLRNWNKMKLPSGESHYSIFVLCYRRYTTPNHTGIRGLAMSVLISKPSKLRESDIIFYGRKVKHRYLPYKPEYDEKFRPTLENLSIVRNNEGQLVYGSNNFTFLQNKQINVLYYLKEHILRHFLCASCDWHTSKLPKTVTGYSNLSNEQKAIYNNAYRLAIDFIVHGDDQKAFDLIHHIVSMLPDTQNFDYLINLMPALVRIIALGRMEQLDKLFELTDTYGLTRYFLLNHYFSYHYITLLELCIQYHDKTAMAKVVNKAIEKNCLADILSPNTIYLASVYEDITILKTLLHLVRDEESLTRCLTQLEQSFPKDRLNEIKSKFLCGNFGATKAEKLFLNPFDQEQHIEIKPKTCNINKRIMRKIGWVTLCAALLLSTAAVTVSILGAALNIPLLVISSACLILAITTLIFARQKKNIAPEKQIEQDPYHYDPIRNITFFRPNYPRHEISQELLTTTQKSFTNRLVCTKQHKATHRNGICNSKYEDPSHSKYNCQSGWDRLHLSYILT